MTRSSWTHGEKHLAKSTSINSINRRKQQQHSNYHHLKRASQKTSKPNKMRPMRASHLRALALVAITALGIVLASADSAVPNQAAHKQQESAKANVNQQQPIDSQQTPQAAAFKQNHQQLQQVAEKKQGDQVVDSLFNSEEYVQIKPEEVEATSGSESSGKEIDPAVLALADLPNAPAAAAAASSPSAAVSSSSQQSQAEHKSAADDELSAHLAQDSIGALESGPRPYAATAAAADPRAARPHGPPARGGYVPSRHAGAGYPRPPPPGYGGPRMGPRRPAQRPPAGRYPGPQLPGTSGYMSLKGKLAGGLSSIVPHAPRPSHYGASPGPSSPAGGYQGATGMQAPSRYLPRGAAAGYAAFREFVRAQANRYKGQQPQQPMGSHEPVAYNAAPPSVPSYGSAQGSVEMASAGGAYRQNAESKPYTAAPAAPEASPPKPAAEYDRPAAPTRSKVTVAQAYIPHLTPSSANPGNQGAYGQASSSSSGPYAPNPSLAKLYGGHAPQGVGRPEYNKDYGMVIHYPQATVYTEPMTVDQLHKLAGSSITQILEQLQYNLATGQRTEANTLRANNKHHLGHGLAIHAKEFYAPGKGGHYVPTTAAVISSHSEPAAESPAYAQGPPPPPPPTQAAGYQQVAPAASYSNELPRAPPQDYRPAAAPQNSEAAQYGLKPELGAGYERVKAAVAASAMKYAMPGAKQAGGEYHQPQPQQQQQHYRQSSGHQYEGMSLMKPYAEPLGALANIIGSELESLYNKANSVLAKQIDPEIHAHVQAHLKSLAKVTGPLKMSEHDHKAPLTLRPHGGSSGPSYGPPPPPPPQHYQGPPRTPHPPPPHPRGRGPRRPVGYEAQAGSHRPAPGRYQPPRQMQPHRPSGYQQQQQHQAQAAYNAEQQAFQQQMNQLLNDFNLGDDNYGAKSRPIQATNQGYPNKVLQKYQQQQQYRQQQQQHSTFPYEHSDGMEIPQGPNDQIGEISELIDALKGTLENKPEAGNNYHASKDGKMEDVQYIASALGQVPSYAIQVPVGHQQQQQPQPQPQPQQQYQQLSGEAAVYDAAKKAEQQQYAAQGPQQPEQQYQQKGQYQQPQQQAYQQQGAQQDYRQASPQVSQQLPYQAPPAPVAPSSGYESGSGESAAQNGYQQQSQPQQQDYTQHQQHQQQSAAYSVQYKHQAVPAQQEAYQAGAASAEAYGAGQQQQQHQESYGATQPSAGGPEYGKGPTEQAQQQQEAAPASYDTSSAAGAYQQPQQQATGEQASQQQQSGYSSSEHTQVINHLVPVQQQQVAAAPDYGRQQQQPQPISAVTTSVSHQPVNQVSVAAPTDSQYQSAQPLSSFVESLPSDYQELLRQPASHASILDNIAGGHPEPLYANATTSDIVKSAPAPAASVPSAPAAAAQASAPATSHHSHHHQRRQYDSHHLSSSASSPKATYLQVSAASSSSGTKSGAQPAPSLTPSTSAASSASQSSPSSSSSASASSSSLASKASSASQADKA